VEEELGQMRLPQEGLDRVRQAVLNILGEEPALDREGLANHLTGRGLGAELAEILSPRVYVHGAFARPEIPDADVLEQWRETWRFMQHCDLGREIGNAAQALAGEFTTEIESRLLALHDEHKTAL
jgi:DNA primase